MSHLPVRILIYPRQAASRELVPPEPRLPNRQGEYLILGDIEAICRRSTEATMKWLLQNMRRRAAFAVKNPRYTLNAIVRELTLADERLLVRLTGLHRTCRRGVPSLREDPGWLVPHWLHAAWQVHLGDAHEILPRLLAQLGKIGILIHDSYTLTVT